LLEQISVHARGEHVLQAKRGVGQVTRLDIKHTDVVGRLPSNHLRAHPNRHLTTGELVAVKSNAPGEEWNEIGIAAQASDVKYASAFKEECSFSGKNNGKRVRLT